MRPFPLLEDAKSKLFLVLFCGFFSAFFIYFYNPFNLQSVTYETAIGRFLSIWNAGILGALILSITQFLLRPVLNLDSFTRGQFLLWVIFEFALLCIGIFIVFGESKEPFLVELSSIVKYTVSLGLLPYILACLVIAVFKLSDVEENSSGNKRMANTNSAGNASSDQISIKDENGKIMLVLNVNQILFLKSEDNYISIFYLQNDQVEKALIRTNLKKIVGEWDHPNLIRIHRSYMVNMQRIDSVQRKKGDFQIQLSHFSDMPLKVSGTYKRIFEAQIEALNQD